VGGRPVRFSGTACRSLRLVATLAARGSPRTKAALGLPGSGIALLGRVPS
jgi:hypothetical protein